MTPPGTAAERWSLADRRDFLRRSLDDADREHEVGDLDDADYELLRRRDLAALTEVEARLDALERADAEQGAPGDGPGDDTAGDDTSGSSAGDGAPGGDASGASGHEPVPVTRGRTGRPAARRRRRVWLAVGGAVAVAAGAVVLVVSLTTARLPGEVATGSIKTTQAKEIAKQLDQAAVLVSQGRVVQALQVYQGVLAIDPHQRAALAESGWLEWESGSQSAKSSLEARGKAAVEKAVREAPGFYAARVYLGTILLDGGHASAAVDQYRRFLADHPPAKWVSTYALEIRTAYLGAGLPVPAGVPTTSSGGS